MRIDPFPHWGDLSSLSRIDPLLERRARLRWRCQPASSRTLLSDRKVLVRIFIGLLCVAQCCVRGIESAGLQNVGKLKRKNPNVYAQRQGANQFSNGVDFQLLDLSRSAMRSGHSNLEL